MSNQKGSFFVHDKTEQTYFTAAVFPLASTVVAFPADPNGKTLADWDAPARRTKIAAVASTDHNLSITWRQWRYFEVSPNPDRLIVRKYEVRAMRELLPLGKSDWNEAEADTHDIEKLDGLAKEAGLPTLGEYYTQICEERKASGSLEDAAHAMISKWTHRWESAAELLEQLKEDLLHRLYLVHHYKHGWYYIVIREGSEEFFRTKNTETLLRSFISHAEEAMKNRGKIRFSYCLREYMPPGVDWKQSPCWPT